MSNIKSKIPVGAKVFNSVYGDGEVIFVNIDFAEKQYKYLIDFGRHGEQTMTRNQLSYTEGVRQ